MSIDNNDNKKNISLASSLSRRGLRSLMFHLFYALDGHDYEVSLESVIDNFNRGFNLNIDPANKDILLVQVVSDNRIELDNLIEPILQKWKLERISISTKLILRLGLWELLNTDIPTNIIINEAIELSKNFAEHDSYKFVNGILDQLAQKERTV